MTEEIIQNQELDEKEIEEAKALTRKERGIRSGFIIGLIFLGVSIISDVFNLVEFRVWQIPAESLGDVASLIVLVISFIRYQRGEKEKAYRLIPLAILLTYTTGELFLSGSLFYNLVSGLLLLGVTYFIFEPENRRYWLQFAAVHVVGVILFGALSIFPKYTLEQGATNFVITSGITVLLLWQLARRYQFRSIQTRLLVTLLGISMIPVLVIGVASSLIDIQRDTTQAEGYLTAIASLKESQLKSWMSRINTDLRGFQEDVDFKTNLETLTLSTPTEGFRQHISGLLLENLEVLKGSTKKFYSLSLVDLNGEIISSTNPDFLGDTLGAVDGFSSEISQFTLSNPTIDQTYGDTVTTVYLPIFNDVDILIGFVTGEVTMSPIQGYFQESFGQLGETGEVYLVNDNRQLLTTLRNSPEFEAGSVLVSGDSADLQEPPPEGMQTATYENYLGEEVLSIRTSLPDLHATLVVEQTTSEVFEFLRLSMVVNAVLSGFMLIIAIVIAVISSRNFTTPIEDLSEAARKVWRGDLERFPEFDRVDEIGELSSTLSQMTSQLAATTTNLEQTVAERTAVLERRASYLEATSQISRATTGIYDLGTLLNTVTQLISENFGYYHVGIFINDERGEFAVLRAANSEGGWKMLAREHKLGIGTQGIVGHVTGTGEPRVQQQVAGEDSVYFDNPDLPETRSEMALPLKVGNEIFGALDVQSTQEQAFSEEDVSVLQVLADAVAVSIQNTRQVEQLQENLESERRLFGEISQETWAKLLSHNQDGFSARSDKAGTQLITSPSSEIGKLAMKEKMPIIGSLDEELHAYPAALPVTARGGVTIGVIETQKPEAAGAWTQEEVSILENVASELGLALDNARLFEETQRRAQRDRIAADLSTKIWASSDVENILQTAVRELGSALNASQGQIKLTMTEEEGTPEVTEQLVDGANQP